MTPEQLAASLIADVPRDPPPYTNSALMYETDVLAALARAMGPDDLVEQAGKVAQLLDSHMGKADIQEVLRDCRKAADLITALLARLSALTAESEMRLQAVQAFSDTADELREENARLRDRLARMEAQIAALEWFSETSAENALSVKKHLDDLNKSAALTETPADGGKE